MQSDNPTAAILVIAVLRWRLGRGSFHRFAFRATHGILPRGGGFDHGFCRQHRCGLVGWLDGRRGLGRRFSVARGRLLESLGCGWGVELSLLGFACRPRP